MSQPPYLLLKKIFKKQALLNLKCLIDVGCGKGRVLVSAKKAGISQLVGIDFSEGLCRICRENLNGTKDRTLEPENLKIICDDVTNLKMNLGDNAGFFLSNPFKADVLDQFLSNVEKCSNKGEAGPLFIYAVPVHKAVFEKRGYILEDFVPSKDTNFLVHFYRREVF